LWPLAVRTWAPCGQTPRLRVALPHDHLAAISGSTPDGRLFMQTQAHAYRSPDVVRFLRRLVRQIRGKLLLIWDGAPIHRGQPIQDFLQRGAAKRLQLEQWPGDAPELNPDAGIWNDLKRVELATVCCPDLPRSARAGAGVAPGQGALAPQTLSYPSLLPTGGLPCLALHAKVSN
jgi:hypothetical protein